MYMISGFRTTAIAILLVMIHFTISLRAGEPSVLISKYLERMSSKQKYACAMYCESTNIDSKSTKNDSYFEFWFLHSYDPETKNRRHDHHRQTAINEEKSLSPGIYATFFNRNGKEFRQWLNSNTVNSNTVSLVIADKDEVDVNKELLKKIYLQTFFDPFFLPVSGIQCFNPRATIDLVNEFPPTLRRYKWIEDEEQSSVIVQRFQTAHPDLEDKIAFDEIVEQMPVLVTRSFVKGGKLYETIATKWSKKNDQWYPVATEIKCNHGSIDKTWKVEYFWMLEDFPKNIFAEGEMRPLRGSELKEEIVKWSERHFSNKSDSNSK